MAVVPVIAGLAGRNSEFDSERVPCSYSDRSRYLISHTRTLLPPPPECAGACLGCVGAASERDPLAIWEPFKSLFQTGIGPLYWAAA